MLKLKASPQTQTSILTSSISDSMTIASPQRGLEGVSQLNERQMLCSLLLTSINNKSRCYICPLVPTEFRIFNHIRQKDKSKVIRKSAQHQSDEFLRNNFLQVGCLDCPIVKLLTRRFCLLKH